MVVKLGLWNSGKDLRDQRTGCMWRGGQFGPKKKGSKGKYEEIR
jgi:hypothetical protein